MKNILFILGLLCFSYNSYAQACTPLGDQITYGTANIWIGYAYDNMDFSSYRGYVNEGAAGSPNFDESFGGDDVTYATNGCGVFTSTFSMRYKLTKTFASGSYIFTVGGDDGYRLSIDGGSTWIINNWGDHGYTTSTYAASLGGSYSLVLEYYENGGGNRVSFDVSAVCGGTENTTIYGTGNIWNGYIYDGTNFDIYSGMVHEGSAGTPNFDESFGGNNVLYATSSCNVQTETFSARYRLSKTFAYGTYAFTIGGDDGYRLSIDGGATWLIDRWYDQSYNIAVSPVVTLNGTYNLVLEFYENGGDNRVSILVQNLTILPVSLTRFDAQVKNNEIELSWLLAAGSTPKQFEVERSADGIHFTSITTTAGSPALNYTALDKNAGAGTWYYRIKITDTNGGISYSGIRVARAGMQGSSDGVFYPSLVADNYIMFKSGKHINNAVASIMDVNGRVVAKQNMATITAGVPVRLSLTAQQKLPPGFYVVKLKGGSGEEVRGKFIVQ